MKKLIYTLALINTILFPVIAKANTEYLFCLDKDKMETARVHFNFESRDGFFIVKSPSSEDKLNFTFDSYQMASTPAEISEHPVIQRWRNDASLNPITIAKVESMMVYNKNNHEDQTWLGFITTKQGTLHFQNTDALITNAKIGECK